MTGAPAPIDELELLLACNALEHKLDVLAHRYGLHHDPVLLKKRAEYLEDKMAYLEGRIESMESKNAS